MAEQWWIPAQQKWSGKLVLCGLLGFPPWPGVALKPRSRSELQGPMNPLAPPTDAVFDREVKCVRRGAGFTVGNTASAHYAVNNPCGGVFGLPETMQSPSMQKAVITTVGRTNLIVKFKGDGHVDKIPIDEVKHQGTWRTATLTHLNPDGTVDACLSDSDISDVEIEDVLVKRLVPQEDTGTPRRSDHAERLIRGPTMQRCGELLAEERPASQGGLQPQNRAQRPWHRRRQFGIRGHGHDNMDLRTCANTGLTKKGLLLQHSSFVWPKHQHHARPEVQKSCRWLLQSHDSETRNVASAAGSLATQPQPQP